MLFSPNKSLQLNRKYKPTALAQDVGRNLEHGMEKGIDYMRDLRSNYGYGYNMGMGRRQGLMSSMIWPWNWFSSSYVACWQ